MRQGTRPNPPNRSRPGRPKAEAKSAVLHAWCRSLTNEEPMTEQMLVLAMRFALSLLMIGCTAHEFQGCVIPLAPDNGKVAVGMPCAPAAPAISGSLVANECGPEHGGYSCPTRVAPHCDLDNGGLCVKSIGHNPERATYDYCEPDMSTNLALGKPVSVGIDSAYGSSTAGPTQWNTERLTDGYIASSGASYDLSIPYCGVENSQCISHDTRAHVTVDLGQPKLLSAVTVYLAPVFSDSGATEEP